MHIFTVAEAFYYCRNFVRAPGAVNSSFTNFLQQYNANNVLTEGTPAFDDFKTAALCEAERLLFLSAVHFKRSHDLLADSSCAWAHTTMYYGTFYSALALLAMFGAWIHFGSPGNVVAHVDNGLLGYQSIIIKKDKHYIKGLSAFCGPHEKFWDVFYSTIAQLIPFLPPNMSHLRSAIEPVLGDPTWLTSKRNDINYSSFNSFNIMLDFQRNFRPRNLLQTLPGDLKIQHQIMEGIVCLTVYYARQFQLQTDALNDFKPRGDRRRKILRNIIYSPGRRIISKDRLSRIFKL